MFKVLITIKMKKGYTKLRKCPYPSLKRKKTKKKKTKKWTKKRRRKRRRRKKRKVKKDL